MHFPGFSFKLSKRHFIVSSHRFCVHFISTKWTQNSWLETMKIPFFKSFYRKLCPQWHHSWLNSQYNFVMWYHIKYWYINIHVSYGCKHISFSKIYEKMCPFWSFFTKFGSHYSFLRRGWMCITWYFIHTGLQDAECVFTWDSKNLLILLYYLIKYIFIKVFTFFLDEMRKFGLVI